MEIEITDRESDVEITLIPKTIKEEVQAKHLKMLICNKDECNVMWCVRPLNPPTLIH